MRNRWGFLVALFLTTGLVALGPPAGASETAYEGFGPSFPTYANGGNGFAGPWTLGGFNAFSSGYLPKDGSLHRGRLQASGGSVFGAAFSSINGAIRSLAEPLGQDNTTVYLSVLLEPEGTLDDGLFGGFFTIDEIRIGTTLADVQPTDYHYRHRAQEGCHEDDDDR
jgi:hypothetical protein